MIKYIGEKAAEKNHAGSKARRDVNEILKKSGYEEIETIIEKEMRTKLEKAKYILKPATWKQILRIKKIKNETIILQYPIYSNRIMRGEIYNLIRRNRTILIIHDVDALRNFGKTETEEEIKRLNAAKILIVHNEKMKEALKKIGVKTKMINLEIFDYLLEKEKPEIKKSAGKKIIFAGNLSKSEFIYNEEIKNLGIELKVYGPGFQKEKAAGNVKYEGSYAPEEVPYKLEGDFGLIWDGESIKECSGNFGEYLKINNPHKLSLYIASGFPVITWKKAAIGEFIKREGIGFTVGSLYEIEEKIKNISEEEKNNYQENLKKLQKKITEGYYLKRALKEMEKEITGE